MFSIKDLGHEMFVFLSSRYCDKILEQSDLRVGEFILAHDLRCNMSWPERCGSLCQLVVVELPR